jgi:hypothetical protein
VLRRPRFGVVMDLQCQLFSALAVDRLPKAIRFG